MHQPIKYRSDIDGLRALAILPVVFYHAGWWPFTGGYIGVDIFFVISGYLITTIISREMKEGTFSFLEFYERRIRRILPALFAVLFFCCCASYFILTPRDYVEFAENLIASIFFLSNISIWEHSLGYFDVDSNVKFLLHTWSLSIEEQFYIIFPPFLIFILFLSRRIFKLNILKLSMLLLLFTSLALSIAVAISGIGVRASFFFLPFRAWELALGALLALNLIPALHSRRVCNLLSVFGLCLICFAVLFYSHDMIYPGYAALLPCLGAAILIQSGRYHVTWVGRMLGWWPFVFVGLISYSLYLWHWPLLVVSRLVYYEGLPLSVNLGVVFASFVMAILSWRYIERPFRGKGGWLNRTQLFALAFLVSAFFIAFGGFVSWSDGWKGRLSKDVIAVLDMWKEIALWHKGIIGPIEDRNFSYDFDGCGSDIVNYNGAPYILVGDSHAKMLGPILDGLAGQYGRPLNKLARVGTDFRYIPVIGVSIEGGLCNTGDVSQEIANSDNIKTVIISSNYIGKILSKQFLTSKMVDLLRDSNMKERFKIFSENLSKDINAMMAHNKRVVLIYPFPGYHGDIPSIQAHYLMSGRSIDDFKIPENLFWDQNREIVSAMDSLGDHPNLIRIKPHEIFCDGVQCKTAVNGKSLYMDSNHLSQAGVNLLRPQLEAIFQDPNWN